MPPPPPPAVPDAPRRARPEQPFVVAGWLVEPLTHRVSRGGAVHTLEPRVMQVLAYLAAHAGEPVKREALLEAVWGTPYLGDDAVSRCISRLRKLFDDDPRAPRVIETISKTGYRLLAPVTPAVPVPAPGGAPAPAGVDVASSVALARPALPFWRRPAASAEREAPGLLTDAAWHALVDDLRHHFGGTGRVEQAGAVRAWTLRRRFEQVHLAARPAASRAAPSLTVLRLVHADARSARAYLLPLAGFFCTFLLLYGHTFNAGTVAGMVCLVTGVLFALARHHVRKEVEARERALAALLDRLAGGPDDAAVPPGPQGA
jgi:DNA-binding winged helix-turn-helix (wHTH) protein